MGRFPFNKNSCLKFWKFHVPSGMVHSGCTDWNNNFVEWKGIFRCNCPKWPDQSKWTTLKGGPKYSSQTEWKWSVLFADFWPKNFINSKILSWMEWALLLGWWDDERNIFYLFFSDTDEPVPLSLPNQWLWDIIDEFIYQVSLWKK